MRIFDGKTYRDATPEEEAQIIADTTGESEPTESDRIAMLEEELKAAKILLGVE